MQESHHVVSAKDANSPKQRADLAELAGSEGIPSNYEENVNLYIAVKCSIMPHAKYINSEYVNILISVLG